MVAQMYQVKNGRILLMIKARPLSNSNEVVGVHEEELVIKVKAQPEKGKANKELVSYLGKLLDCRKSDIRIITGETSRHKLVELPLEAKEPLDDVLDSVLN
jgi:uncharacterized protein (TIGR00251 family)